MTPAGSGRRITAFFSRRYAARTPTASMRKLGPVARAAQKAGYVALHDPGSLDPGLLRRLHAPEYVDGYLKGEEPHAGSAGWDWTSQIRDGVLAMNAGQLAAARTALAEGIAVNVAQGFHHATPASGGCYCTFNGLALVAQEFPDLTVAVLDADAHGGNGTGEFTERLPNLRNFTINGSAFGCPENEPSVVRTLREVSLDFAPYEAALREAFDQVLSWKTDLMIYQAGVDPHEDDPLSRMGMTTGQMALRDRLVFEFTRREKLPVFFVLAGGYQTPIRTKLVPLHLLTFQAAWEAYGQAAE
ncbi:MAG: histone deacetylase [Limisphaerales bacterium]